jgi:hypothetical protein
MVTARLRKKKAKQKAKEKPVFKPVARRAYLKELVFDPSDMSPKRVSPKCVSDLMLRWAKYIRDAWFESVGCTTRVSIVWHDGTVRAFSAGGIQRALASADEAIWWAVCDSTVGAFDGRP